MNAAAQIVVLIGHAYRLHIHALASAHARCYVSAYSNTVKVVKLICDSNGRSKWNYNIHV